MWEIAATCEGYFRMFHYGDTCRVIGHYNIGYMYLYPGIQINVN